MAKRLVTPPEERPVSVDDVKLALRIDHNDSDANLEDYIDAATDHAQEYLGRALVTQTWELVLDEFPEAEIELPMPPLQEVESIKYDDEDGNEQTVSTDDYTVDTVSAPGWVVPNTNSDWPTPLEAINAVRIRYVAGYAPNEDSPPDLTENIPQSIKQAIILMVKYWYDGEMDIDKLHQMPIGVEPLLRKYRVLFGMR